MQRIVQPQESAVLRLGNPGLQEAGPPEEVGRGQIWEALKQPQMVLSREIKAKEAALGVS